MDPPTNQIRQNQTSTYKGKTMKVFKFSGYSDDTFGESTDRGDDYDNCASGDPIWWELKAADGSGIIITGMYGNDIYSRGDGWMIGANVIDEYKPVDWSIVMNVSHEGYRNELIVEVPDDVELRCLNRD